MRIFLLSGLRSPLVRWSCARSLVFVSYLVDEPEMLQEMKEDVLKQRRG